MDFNFDELQVGLPTAREVVLAAQNPVGVRPVVRRALTAEDIALVDNAAVGVAQAPSVQRLRQSHHRLAQLIASGIKDVEAARLTGYSPSRISILKNDPAFKELLTQYKDIVEEKFSDTIEVMKHVTDDALSLIHERMLDEPDSISTAQLTEIVTKIGDRAGFAPVTKSVNLTAPLSAETLAHIKGKVQGRQNGQIKKLEDIEGVCAPVSGNLEPVISGNSGGASPL